ncbi:MAG: HD domain-containing protein [Limnochordia bacterium]|nr:HD domain-containing protein [Limnochordia bacterium]MDD2756904.1 HD domain-containing protein [Methanothrix sp.]MDD4518586.1 HD domain-containing protein [Limnochordia bacterium]
MNRNLFQKCGITEEHAKWESCIRRESQLYAREGDMRSEFVRDYNRILHSLAYRRLKHKTQVFFATSNDHVCTRIEHVNHVASVSYTVAKFLGLNTELTTAIATGHDLGHPPFGHTGEKVLARLMKDATGDDFWHERNGLVFVDDYETIPDPEGFESNLNLTYAVRDGIVLHCGEVDETAIRPRNEIIDLRSITHVNAVAPYTWEGCVVKVADKISYLGRDIEDAMLLGILSDGELDELSCILRECLGETPPEMKNTFLMHVLMVDLCDHSCPNSGIQLSKKGSKLMARIRDFSNQNIYAHKRISIYNKYADLIINSIYDTLMGYYDGRNTLNRVLQSATVYPKLADSFAQWLVRYSTMRRNPVLDGKLERIAARSRNRIIDDILDQHAYVRTVVAFISGMTDLFAVKIFEELTTF